MSEYTKDAVERVVWTFVQAAAAFAVVGLADDNFDIWTVAKGAAVAGIVAVLKVAAARKVGDTDTASLP